MYQPRPVPNTLSPEARAWLEEELKRIAYWLNAVLKGELP